MENPSKSIAKRVQNTYFPPPQKASCFFTWESNIPRKRTNLNTITISVSSSLLRDCFFYATTLDSKQLTQGTWEGRTIQNNCMFLQNLSRAKSDDQGLDQSTMSPISPTFHNDISSLPFFSEIFSGEEQKKGRRSKRIQRWGLIIYSYTQLNEKTKIPLH